MEYIQFNKVGSTTIEVLYDKVDSISILTTDGLPYHECSITWEQGRTRSVEFDNYRFVCGTSTIWPENVTHVAFEDEDKEQFIKDNKRSEFE